MSDPNTYVVNKPSPLIKRSSTSFVDDIKQVSKMFRNETVSCSITQFYSIFVLWILSIWIVAVINSKLVPKDEVIELGVD